MLATFWVQQYFTFTVLLLNILWSLLEGGKWWRNSWRNLFPTFVETALLKGGLNQIMLRWRFFFVWLLLVLLNFRMKSVYPLSLRVFLYWYLDELKTSSLEEFLDKRLLITFGNWLIICGGWFEDLLIYNNKSFGFLYRLCVPLFKLNVMSKKSTILRLVSTSMEKTISLNILITFLRIRSICWRFTFCNMSSSSALYSPQPFLLNSFAKKKSDVNTNKFEYLCTVKISYCYIEAAFCFFLFHASLLLNSKDLRQCFIHLLLSLDISWCSFANNKALSKMISVMDG